MFKHAQLTAREIHGPYMQLLSNLQGDEGRTWLAALKRFLRKENPWDGKPLHKVWKTVRTGQFKDAEDMFKALSAQGFTVNKPARAMFLQSEITFSKEVLEYDLVIVTPKELGFEKSPNFHELYQAVIVAGLQPVPPEVVAAARLVFREQRWEEDVEVIMTPLKDHSSEEMTLDLRHCDDPYEDGKAIIGIGSWDSLGHFLGGHWLCVSEVRTVS